METAEPLSDLVSAEGRNRKAVLCQRCGSRVLQPGAALFSRRQVLLIRERGRDPGAGGAAGSTQEPDAGLDPGPEAAAPPRAPAPRVRPGCAQDAPRMRCCAPSP
uniref:guanine nucleotide exchange factor MSS4 isoform X2 n=1 Tax=Nyctereutes procyonoides TaxID=34880 RepID=UPI002443A24B|nr:guanine nucleotide exchange factor MSS4 isoform X2 [Nyctereutes procyonoides]XP_055175111.1 guanine nucleotide exchange factor MSS4 isoform X2 [Nyctereutes procyonoides]